MKTEEFNYEGKYGNLNISFIKDSNYKERRQEIIDQLKMAQQEIENDAKPEIKLIMPQTQIELCQCGCNQEKYV